MNLYDIAIAKKLSGGGGGGGGEFPIATVTFNVTGDERLDNVLTLIPIDDVDFHIMGLYKDSSNKYFMDLPETGIMGGHSTEYTIMMLDSSFKCMAAHNESSTTVSGNATIDSNYIVTVTGDCIITVDAAR